MYNLLILKLGFNGVGVLQNNIEAFQFLKFSYMFNYYIIIFKSFNTKHL